LDRNDAQRIIDLAVSRATADDTVVHLSVGESASTRFSNNAISQNMATQDQALTVQSAFGNKVGSAYVSDLSEEAVREAVRRAEAIASAAEPDTEYMPPVEPQTYPEILAYADRTAAASPADRAEAVRQAVDEARSIGAEAAGSIATSGGVNAIGNSRGLFGFQASTDFALTVTIMTGDSSGWAERSGVDIGDLDAAAVARRACRKASLGRSPRTIDAKPYTVILEPAAACEMLEFLLWNMDAKAADEGRSAFVGKEGFPIGAPLVTIETRPDDPRAPLAPWSEGGEVSPHTVWVKDGVLRTLAYNRFYARKSDKPFTDSLTALTMAGEDRPLDDLIASVDYGLLVTRFWYIRSVDPMQLLLTGMTRDGLFLIEKGEITGGVRNFRFNESPLRMLRNTQALGVAEVTNVYTRSIVPPMLVREFAFTSGTTF